MPQSKNKIVRDLTSGNVTWTMITFAAPLFLSSLLQTIYNVTDMIIVGRFVGKAGLGAVSIGTDILHFLCFIAMGFSNAGQVIISQLIGAGNVICMLTHDCHTPSSSMSYSMTVGIVTHFFAFDNS